MSQTKAIFIIDMEAIYTDMTKLYHALTGIYPRVTYGIEVWGKASKLIISRIEKNTGKSCTMCREGSLFRTHFATFPKVTYVEISASFRITNTKANAFVFSQYDSTTYSRVVCSK